MQERDRPSVRRTQVVGRHREAAAVDRSAPCPPGVPGAHPAQLSTRGAMVPDRCAALDQASSHSRHRAFPDPRPRSLPGSPDEDRSGTRAPGPRPPRRRPPGRQRATYVLDQVVSYAYPARARNLHQKLVVVPPARHGDQVRVADELAVRCSAPTRSRRMSDRFGNSVLYVKAPEVDGTIDFDVRVVVEQGRPDGLRARAVVRPGAAARRLAPRLTKRSAMSRPTCGGAARPETSSSWSRPSGRTSTGRCATSRASPTWARRRPGRGAARPACARTWRTSWSCCAGSTASRRATCRATSSVRAPATPGSRRSCGGADRDTVVAFDPTHDRRTDLRYLTVAVGRDYGDVTPTSGTYESDCAGSLTITKSLTRHVDGVAPLSRRARSWPPTAPGSRRARRACSSRGAPRGCWPGCRR